MKCRTWGRFVFGKYLRSAVSKFADMTGLRMQECNYCVTVLVIEARC